MLVWKAQSQFQQQNSVKLPVIEDLCGPNLRWRVNVYFLVYPFYISQCRIMIMTTLLWATSPNIVYCAYRRVHRCQNRRTLVRSSQKQSQLRPDKNQSSAQRPVDFPGLLGYRIPGDCPRREEETWPDCPACTSLHVCSVTWVCRLWIMPQNLPCHQ